MKKTWEINAVTLEDSIKIAFKQIQKFTEKRKLAPVALTLWEERSTEVAVSITFKDGEATDMAAWINNQRTANV